MKWEKSNWLSMAFTTKGSVIPSIAGRVMLCVVFGALISLLHTYKYPVAQKSLADTVPAVVLGLLLVFRTNTAYDRFWEGRKAWGSMNNNIRNLVRIVWLSIDERVTGDRERKIAALEMLPAFAIATKLYLRGQPLESELSNVFSTAQLQQLNAVQNPVLQIAFWLGDYLQSEHRRGNIGIYQMNELQRIINNMVDSVGTCERILRTPMPLAYAIHLKQLLLIYCLLLPFKMVGDLGWGTAPVVGLVSFTLFGIEAIGVEIENPFGNDPNDLPLDNICKNIQRTIEDTINYGHPPDSLDLDLDVN
jgi:ion channel-forming bestrophin family protein